MNWSLFLLTALAVQVNVAVGEKRKWGMGGAASTKPSLSRRPSPEADAKEASISNFQRNKGLAASPPPFLKLRGGGGTIANFSKYIGDSRSRSWVVLLISILLDSMSSTMMKMGRDEGSIVKLATAYLGFFTRYTTELLNDWH